MSNEVKIPNPDVDPVAYLMAKGWKPEEGQPNRYCKWIDPTQPTKATEKQVKRMTRTLPGGKEEDVFQTEVTPAAWPVSREEAVAVQRARDLEATSKK